MLSVTDFLILSIKKHEKHQIFAMDFASHRRTTLISICRSAIQLIRHFSVAPYITICPSTESYCGLYLRGAMSAVTGIYLFRLLLNIIGFALRSFLPKQTVHTLMKCRMMAFHQFASVKNTYRKIYFTIEMQPNIFLKVMSCSIHVCIHLL